jgi:hypothetical protein
MNSRAKYGRTNPEPASAPEEEELETGEPIPEEVEPTPPPAAGKIAAMRGKFGGGAPSQSKSDNSGGGQIELATAKYLKRDPEPELRRDQEKRKAKEEATGGSLEGNVFNSGMMGGLAAMGIAVVWFLIGLMNDFIFFYPPILFVLGLVAFFKGMMKGE